MTQAVLESHAFDDFEVAHADITKHRPKATQGRFDAANFAWAARHLARMTRIAGRFRPDVAYVPVAGNYSAVLRDLALAGIARRSGARVLGHQHAGDIHGTLQKQGIERRLLHAGFEAFDRMLVLGERWRPLLEDFGLRCPIAVVPSTFRREVYEHAARVPVRAPHEGPSRALFVGHYGRGKGTLDLLAAVAALRARGTALDLTIVGPPQRSGDAAESMALRGELGLEREVRFTGPLTGDPLWDAYASADLFVLPSHAEGLPVVLYEAGAFGLPVVTTPVGAVTDLVAHERNGLLVEPGDVAALADALERMACDPALRRQLGAALRAGVEAFHPDRICARIADHVREVLAGAPAARAGS